MAQESSCSRWRADRSAAGESHAARLPFVVVSGLARKNPALMTRGTYVPWCVTVSVLCEQVRRIPRDRQPRIAVLHQF